MGAATSRRPSHAQRAAQAAVKGWETRRAREAERQRVEAERRAVLSERAFRAAATRRANRERAAATALRRSEASKRAWVERKTLGPKELDKLRSTRKLDKERERYERAERKAIQTEVRRKEFANLSRLGKLESKRILRAGEKLLTATDENRARRRAIGRLHLDRIEALGYRRDLVRKNVPESVILKVKITDHFAVQQLATALGVSAHAIYTMRLSPKATGGHASQASADQAKLELSGGR